RSTPAYDPADGCWASTPTAQNLRGARQFWAKSEWPSKPQSPWAAMTFARPGNAGNGGNGWQRWKPLATVETAGNGGNRWQRWKRVCLCVCQRCQRAARRVRRLARARLLAGGVEPPRCLWRPTEMLCFDGHLRFKIFGARDDFGKNEQPSK